MENPKETIWFVYDGECPICRAGVKGFRVKKAVGNLETLNKRTAPAEHPVIKAINKQGLDLNNGMVIYYGGKLYQGSDALHLMAFIGNKRGWLNRILAVLFRRKSIAKLCYPFLRGARNMLVWWNGAGKIAS